MGISCTAVCPQCGHSEPVSCTSIQFGSVRLNQGTRKYTTRARGTHRQIGDPPVSSLLVMAATDSSIAGSRAVFAPTLGLILAVVLLMHTARYDVVGLYAIFAGFITGLALAALAGSPTIQILFLKKMFSGKFSHL